MYTDIEHVARHNYKLSSNKVGVRPPVTCDQTSVLSLSSLIGRGKKCPAGED